VRFKIPKDFIMNKLPRVVETWARFFTWIFGMILAILTVVNVLSLMPENTRFWLLIALILFLIAGLIVLVSDARSRSTRRHSNQQDNTAVLTHMEQSGRNRWISIGLLILVAVVIGLIFVARQLPPTPQGYQAFFTAFAAIAALLTGIALAVFAYQQYKLRQTEHRLLFDSQILLRSAETPITGELTYNNQRYPYRIEWTVLILNTSQQPIIIEFMSLRIRQWGWEKASYKDGYLSLPSYHVLEPEGLESPFQVTQTTPQRIRWIIESYNAGMELDDSFGDSNNRNFQLIFYVQAINPQDPSTPIIKGIVSNPFHVPKDAPWGNKIAKLT